MFMWKRCCLDYSIISASSSLPPPPVSPFLPLPPPLSPPPPPLSSLLLPLPPLPPLSPLLLLPFLLLLLLFSYFFFLLSFFLFLMQHVTVQAHCASCCKCSKDTRLPVAHYLVACENTWCRLAFRDLFHAFCSIRRMEYKNKYASSEDQGELRSLKNTSVWLLSHLA